MFLDIWDLKKYTPPAKYFLNILASKVGFACRNLHVNKKFVFVGKALNRK